MSLLKLLEVTHSRSKQGDDASEWVDIIAVHGLSEHLTEAWTDPETQILWLRDLLPKSIRTARVLSFGYDATPFSFYRDNSVDRILQHAQTLVATIQADRSLEGCSQRPIIFVCHGLGGIMIKKALAYASTRTSKNVEHLYSVYVSTYAVLFFGTPHNGTQKANWLLLHDKRGIKSLMRPEESEILEALEKNSETLEAITDSFAPLMKQFSIFFFWEQIPTSKGHRKSFIVDESSAGPIIDNTERSGIYANHTGMVQFSSPESAGYRTVIEALMRYCRNAPSLIRDRWERAHDALARMRFQEASELAGVAFDVYGGDNLLRHQREEAERPRNKHFYIPQVVSSIFTGRETQSYTVEQALFSGTGIENARQQRRYVVHGMGGSGKTQFCCKFAQDYRDKFWGVFYIDATTMETAKTSFAQLGKLGKLEATQSAGKHWLSHLEQPWLLIINNADDPKLDLESLFPEGQRGSVLITTRNPNFAVHATVGSLELGQLAKEEALMLLLRSAGVPKPWDALTEETGGFITRALGYLALALTQAGALILQKICSLSDYLNYYNRHREHFGQRRIANGRTPTDFTVFSTWDLSLYSLDSRQTTASQDAIEILNIAAFFHFEHIPVDVFIRADVNRAHSLRDANSRSLGSILLHFFHNRIIPSAILPKFLKENDGRPDPYRIRKALNELRSVSLISYDGKTESFSLHPIVHAWAKDRHFKGQQQLWSYIALSVLTESVLLPPAELGECHQEYRSSILVHLDVCLSHHPIEIQDFADLAGGARLLFAFAFNQCGLLRFREHILQAAKVGYIYAERGRFAEAAKHLSMVKCALVKSRGVENEATMRAMLALAKTYWGLGRLKEGIELETQVVEAQKQTLGPEHRQTLLTMDQLGCSYWLNGQYHEALEVHTRVTDCMKRTLKEDDEDMLTALDNLGITLGSWHRFEESMKVHRQVLRQREKLYEPYDLRTLTTMNNLAMALLDLKQFADAEELMLTVCKERKSKLGKEHPWTLWAICNLARVHLKMRRFKDAEDALVPGIEAARRSLSDDHLGVLMGVGLLARAHSEQGQLEESEHLGKSVIERIETARGPQHPDTAYAYYRFARLQERKGDLLKAIEICTTALEKVNMRLTTKHPLGKKIEDYLQELQSKKTASDDKK